ncbi:Y-family DNA polymerase [Burkholderia gladioli]|uniref:Y-family DNA polymerase n=2 Tax=Burkholderia gladioli TaxID=28095 RepID=UPI002651B0C4|nr:Y-family DNA polymerase [Burkholderia gladioli]MDN7919202.1 Y-family DNA polymerase [Burkholderia gladioli]
MRRLALVDGNNFYCSCERVFRPDLIGRPLIVLSNNDGCAVARSSEAKQLGVKMGQPFFEIRHLVREAGLIALSSNYARYADMSQRMMDILAQYAPRQEVYSIDESFLDLTGLVEPGVTISERIRAQIEQWIGIPTCVGIGPSKTLAKLTNHVAKKELGGQASGVCDLTALPSAARDRLIDPIHVEEVWGVGRRVGAQLRAMRIGTVGQLRRAPADLIRRRFSVVLERTVRELNGEACLDIDDIAERQQIVCSRSFGAEVTQVEGLVDAMTEFVAKAAERLRGQQLLASQLQVFIRTNPFRTQPRQTSSSLVISLVVPTYDTIALLRVAILALRHIYRPGFRYAKAGVMLFDLVREGRQQRDLFAETDESRHRLMATVDGLNARYGGGTIRIGRTEARQAWEMKQTQRTPAYTTDWSALPIASARP